MLEQDSEIITNCNRCQRNLQERESAYNNYMKLKLNFDECLFFTADCNLC